MRRDSWNSCRRKLQAAINNSEFEPGRRRLDECRYYTYTEKGTAEESEHYKPLFPADEVIGVDYQTFSPWETGKEIWSAVDELAKKHEDNWLIANSIGVFSA